ncbi:hypothetical protein PybrP1_011590 [[Pythium] brassicae (nom. inval.)]|nr:hypothetical protein PybrP1_011590 [[Pythium] brassicae (nom. inval.)]
MANVELKDLAPLLLKKERSGGDMNPAVLTNILQGGAAKNARRKQLQKFIADHPVLSDRDMLFRNHAERYNFGIKKTYHWVKLVRELKITDPEEVQMLYSALGEPLGVDVHRAMFVPTFENQATDEQQANRKWWPGGLGKTANHAIVHARLFLEGKDVGIQAFLVQLRSLEDHQPLPGIEVGDIGPKVGFQSIDNGYAAFHNVRIPRDHMMMRYAKVLPDGSFVTPKSDKLVYLTMVQVRAYMIGRKASGKGEFQVLDYQNQQHALFPSIAISYAAHFASTAMTTMHDDAVAIIKSGEGAFGLKLAELHAVSSGLKAWLALKVADGIESCRRLCGGHGFTNASNLGHLFAEIVGANTFEGTFDVLVQQHSRYLLKVLVTLPLKDVDAGAPAARQAADFANLTLLLEAFERAADEPLNRTPVAESYEEFLKPLIQSGI